MTDDFRPNPLDLDRIHRSCRHLMIGSDVRYCPSVDSTNRLARDLPSGDRRNGTVIMSEYQAQGRGRAGRTWTAPPRSSVLLSVILTPAAGSPPSYLVMLAALSVSDAITDTTGLTPTIKWPNDVLLEGKKVCGILAENVPGGDRPYAVIGIGLNVNFDPRDHPDLPATSTSLMAALGEPVEREDVVEALFNRLDMWYRCFTQQPAAIFASWSARLDTIGQSVLVVDASGSWKGVAARVLPDGGLVMQDDGGDLKTVYAADVSIRKPGDYTGP